MKKAKKSSKRNSKKKQASRPSSKRGSARAVPGDIVQLILQDHKELRQLVKVMKNNSNELSEREAAFKEFAPLLLAHAKPEELVWYPILKEMEKLREEGFESEVEHTLADQMVEEAKRSDDEDELGAKIRVLAELVENHMEEEESEVLPLFKKIVEIDERVRLGEEFLMAKHKIESEGSDDAPPEREIRRPQQANV